MNCLHKLQTHPGRLSSENNIKMYKSQTEGSIQTDRLPVHELFSGEACIAVALSGIKCGLGGRNRHML